MSHSLSQRDLDAFCRRFSMPPDAWVRSPGRVNLIGGHLDYHEGFVLPLAIEPSIILLGAKSSGTGLRVFSESLGAGVEVEIGGWERHPAPLGRYIQGLLRALEASGMRACGCEVLISGDLPPGAGLASSSALVVGLGALLAELCGFALDALELAQLGSDAEHRYGTTGGIMDQYVITHARQGGALLIDCRALTHDFIPLPAGVSVVVAHTGRAHDQITSPFGQRRIEAEEGLRVLKTALPHIRTLRDVDLVTLESHRGRLMAADPGATLWRRCRHVVTEMQRVRAAAEALRQGALDLAGQLMTDAHTSLRDDYAVSTPELDRMFEAAIAGPGCYGARMTGGGFGGCVVSLVEATQVGVFSQEVAQRYTEATGRVPMIFATRPMDGVQAAHLT